jgi:P27 family predicted phage terminase small subunit
VAKKTKPKTPPPTTPPKIIRTTPLINPCRLTNASVGVPGSNEDSPAHLADETREWWVTVATEYQLESHHRRLLTLACESWDRGVQAREALAAHGTTYTDRWGQPRARPEVAMERDARIGFARLVRELALDIEPPDDTGRPPRIEKGVGRRPSSPGLDDDDRQALGLD